MEGPSLVILKEPVKEFKGKKITRAPGYADIDYTRIEGQMVKDFKTWGKHFLIHLFLTTQESPRSNYGPP